MPRLLVVLPVAALAGTLLGLMAGGIWVQLKTGSNALNGDMFLLLRQFPGWDEIWEEPWASGYRLGLIGAALFAGFALLLSFGQKLTEYGQAHFQSKAEIRRNGLLQPIGRGLVFGKLGKPNTSKAMIAADYDKFPHCLVVAPTRAGKGVGYAIPNLLLFPGSMVVLDVKGELFEATSRHRQTQGDAIFYFSPFDFDHPSHRYNPLERVARIRHADECYTELAKIADYFLTVSDKGSAGDFLTEGRDLFIAAGLLAIERGRPTIGEISRILFGQGATSSAYAAHAEEVKHLSAAQTFRKFAGYSDRTLSSHASVLSGAGLSLWNNPAVDRATSGNDFSFADLRRQPMAVYLVVNADAIKTLAPLIRLFFGELIATLRASMPDPVQEPWPVKIMLDEFDQLGPMPIIVQSLKQLAGHGGRVSIITQSIPGLESTPYSENERLGIESAAGIKLYLAPNEKKTAEEVSEGLGKTTKLAISDSLSRDGSGLLRRSISRRNEERPLMSPDELKKLDRDKVILIPERQHPIIAERIVYYEDPYFKALMAAQKGPLPYPSREGEGLRRLRETVEDLTRRIEGRGIIPYPAMSDHGPLVAGETPNQEEKPKGSAAPPAQAKPASPKSEVNVLGPTAQAMLQEIEQERPELSAQEMLDELKPQEQRALETMQGIEQKLLRKLGA
ncbi:type IV secretory system conjugative DNA transfer family protein [Paracoccus litorisediminis]|uniref:type IV secretory system conjugative DNA transfer family protein n=1 Tax=Paracoccus litorisediminis TaxID=2006130 RepID=UPI00372E2B94